MPPFRRERQLSPLKSRSWQPITVIRERQELTLSRRSRRRKNQQFRNSRGWARTPLRRSEGRLGHRVGTDCTHTRPLANQADSTYLPMARSSGEWGGNNMLRLLKLTSHAFRAIPIGVTLAIITAGAVSAEERCKMGGPGRRYQVHSAARAERWRHTRPSGPRLRVASGLSERQAKLRGAETDRELELWLFRLCQP